MFKPKKLTFSQRIEKNSLFIAVILAATLVSCTMVLVKQKEKTKRIDKKIEIKVLSKEGEKKI